MKQAVSTYHKRLEKVLRHIEANLHEPPSLEKLSKVACLSPFHFHRIFTAMVGETVAAYVRRLVLQRAAYYLSYNRETPSITELALNSGYESADAFSRAFRSFFFFDSFIPLYRPVYGMRLGVENAVRRMRTSGPAGSRHIRLQHLPR